MKRLTGAHELLDGPLERATLAANLRDLARVNQLLGGSAVSWRALAHVLADTPTEADVSLLDVGTGAGDIPLSLLRRARRAGRRLHIEAVDSRPEIVALARARAERAGEPRGALNVSLTPPDALGFPDRAFDVVHASLVLHHHDEPPARAFLAELGRVARRAVIVNDLERARRFLAGAWLLARVATANRYTRHDAPLSVRRAYTAAEVLRLAGSVGLVEDALFRDRLGHRYALVLRPGR